MALDTLLIQTIVDPDDRGPLFYFEDRALLYNPRTKTTYAVVDSIPVLLSVEATALDVDAAAELDGALGEAIETHTGRR